jgi:uncharacterized iron-regulated protein
MKTGAHFLIWLLVLAGLFSACQTERKVGEDRLFDRAIQPETLVVEPPRFAQVGDDQLAFIDGRSGFGLSISDVIARARVAEVVIVSEFHDEPAHHRLQELFIRELAHARGRLALGLEMVDWRGQEALTRYQKGEIDLDGLQQALDWSESWGFSFELYRDLLIAGKEKGVQLWGLNAPPSLVKRVSAEGLAGLGNADKMRLPEMDLSHSGHRKALREVFEYHGHHRGHGGVLGEGAQSEKAFERFYAAQVLRDETMAARTLLALEKAERVVVATGAGHVAAGAGIPMRILRRNPDLRVLSLVPIWADPDNEEEDIQSVARQAIIDGEGDVLVVVKSREVINL